jgi:DNA mismatch repair protein MutS2
MIPQNSLDLLEFTKILEIIAQYAKSDASQNAILSLIPLSRKEEIQTRFSCIEEIRRMSHEKRPLNILPFKDIAPVLQTVRPEDAMLEPSDLVCFMDFLVAAHEAALQIKEDSKLTELNILITDLTGRPELLHSLNSSIDREGNIMDSASLRLAELRTEKRRLENRIRKRLEEIIQDEKVSVFLQDNFITQRSGRWVIPVRMDSKGQVSGVVHDVSRTGETAFIEPIAIIAISNELENIIADEKGEEIKILRELGSRIREHADEIEEEFKTLVFLDVLNSIAQTAEKLNMHIPEINEQNIIHLSKAKHPLLLYAAMQKKNPPVSPFPKGGVKDFFPVGTDFKSVPMAEGVLSDEIIPIDVELGGDKTVMTITGPNAGGKTVAIKTIGLLSVMALSGMPIPAADSTAIPLFHNLLVDIGDRQSIADNLSTFSAHLANMMEFLSKADSSTLVLIDELGTGTDPEEGAALSCAILRELKQRGSLIFATTHLTDIKVFVHKEENMVNASMEFDQKTHAPLYRLRTGEPGQSFALETAKRYGLPENIIQSAKTMLGKRKADLESLIHDLDQKRKHYEEAIEDLNRQSRELRQRENRVEELFRDAEASKKEMLAKAYKEASEIVLDMKRQMNSLLEKMKKSSKDKARELVKEVTAVQEQVVEKIREYEVVESLSMDELREGDRVFVKPIAYDATIIKLVRKSNRLRVKAGNIEMEIPLSNVAKLVPASLPSNGSIGGFKRGRGKEVESGRGAIMADTSEEATPSELNLIGLRVDEALTKLEYFLNHAVLAGHSEVTIIHGIGTGILSKAVREHLAAHPLIKSFRGGGQSEGGGGVTVVMLK